MTPLPNTTIKLCVRCKKRPRTYSSRFCASCKGLLKIEKKKRLEEKKRLQKEKKKTLYELSEKYLDVLWGKATKLYYGGKCEVCGKEQYINSHHIYSRSNRAVRWDIDNASLLCPKHHTFDTLLSAHKAPAEFMEFIKEKRGIGWYNRLRAKANMVHRDKLEQKEILKKIIDKYERNCRSI